MSLTVRLISTTAALRALVPAWTALCERADSELAVTPTWLMTWWQVFGAEDLRGLRVLACSEGDRLVGLAPLLRRPTFYRRLMPVRRLELVGSGERERDEICSDYNGIVAEPGYEAAVVDAVIAELAAHRSWEHLLLHGLDGSSPLVPLLERALAAHGMPSTQRELSICPYIALPRTFEEYVAALSPSKRKFVRKCLRDFEKWAPDHRFVVAEDRAGLAEGQRILQTLHGTRWQEDGESGVFASSKFAAFHREMMATLLDKKALQLGWVMANDRPQAIIYNFLWKGRSHSYQSGRAVDLPNSIRVGIVAHLYAIQDSIGRGLAEYDFLAGRQRYKLELSKSSRPLIAISAWRRPWLAGGQRVIDRGIALARTVKQRLRPAAPPPEPPPSSEPTTPDET